MKLSVALCTYNGEKYIKKQLESIIYQSVCVDEIVIRDDGSQDSTLDIIYKVANNHPDISFNIKQNKIKQGVVKNFEEAISACHGDLIFLSDQDDIWDNKKVEIIRKYFFNNPEKDTVFTNATLIDENNNICYEFSLFDFYFNKETQYMFNNGLKYVVFQTNHATGATMAFRRKSFSSIIKICDSLEYYHDGAIALLSLNRNALGYIDDPLIGYRIHPSQQVGLGGSDRSTNHSSGYLHTYPMIQIEMIEKLLLLPLNSRFRETLLFMIKRVRLLEKINGFWMYIGYYLNRKYRKCFGEYDKILFRHDIGFWWHLRTSRLNSKIKKKMFDLNIVTLKE